MTKTLEGMIERALERNGALTPPESTLIRDQVKKWTRDVNEVERVVLVIRHDDACGNGHNTFSMTVDLYERRDPAHPWRLVGCGANPSLIEQRFPEFKGYTKWHLCSTEGPLHYEANTIYHASEIGKDQGQFYVYLDDPERKVKRTLLGIYNRQDLALIQRDYPAGVIDTVVYPNPHAKSADLEAARHCAIWPDATLAQLRNRDLLRARLQGLLHEFKRDVESLGFVY